jgi:hypothetical protein
VIDKKEMKTPENHEERKRVPRRRVRNSPLNIQGEQHQFPTLPQGVLPTFSGDGVMDPKKHMDKFLSMCEIHLVEHDDVMVIIIYSNIDRPSL